MCENEQFINDVFDGNTSVTTDEEKQIILNYILESKIKLKTNELWLPIKGFEKTLVSDLGRIKSLHYNMIRKGSFDNDGYLWIKLNRPGDKVFNKRFIHTLVCETFLGPRPKDYVVRHYPDQSKTNNKLENLSWSTQSQNVRDKVESTSSWSKKPKLTETEVLQIQQDLESGLASPQDMIIKYNLSAQSLWSIITGSSWTDITGGGIIVKNTRKLNYRCFKQLSQQERLDFVLDFKVLSDSALSYKYKIKVTELKKLFRFITERTE